MRGHLPLVAVVVEPLVLAVEDMEVVTMVAMEVVAVVALEVSGSSGGSLGHSGLVRRGGAKRDAPEAPWPTAPEFFGRIQMQV
eukprot:s808_g7.t2